MESFFEDENGVTALEYALLGALVSVVVATTVTLLSNQVLEMFKKISENIVTLNKQ